MSLVEILNEITLFRKKLVGKYLKDEGIYIFSKPEVYIPVTEQTISVTPYYTDVMDFSLYGGERLFFIYNKEDVPIYTDFLVSPIANAADEDFVSIKTVKIDSNDVKIGIMRNNRHLYMKLKLYAESAPSSGYTSVFIVRWGM